MRLSLAVLLPLTLFACQSAPAPNARPTTLPTTTPRATTAPSDDTTPPATALDLSSPLLFSAELMSTRGDTRQVLTRLIVITRANRTFGVETQQTIAPYGQVDVSWSFTTQALEADAGIELSATITVSRAGEPLETHETTDTLRAQDDTIHRVINLAGDQALELHAVITAYEPD